MSTHMISWRNKKIIMWITYLICSYGFPKALLMSTQNMHLWVNKKKNNFLNKVNALEIIIFPSKHLL